MLSILNFLLSYIFLVDKLMFALCCRGLCKNKIEKKTPVAHPGKWFVIPLQTHGSVRCRLPAKIHSLCRIIAYLEILTPARSTGPQTRCVFEKKWSNSEGDCYNDRSPTTHFSQMETWDVGMKRIRNGCMVRCEISFWRNLFFFFFLHAGSALRLKIRRNHSVWMQKMFLFEL